MATQNQVIKWIDSKLHGAKVDNIGTGVMPHPYELSQEAKSYLSSVVEEFDSDNIDLLKKTLSCGHKNCTLTAQEHIEQNVVYIHLTRDVTRDELNKNRIVVKDITSQNGFKIDGVGVRKGTFNII